MTRSQLIELLADPGLLDDKTLPPLKEVLDAYPFFQAGRMLWIKNLHQLDHIRYNSELKSAAAYVPDRSKLFFLINDLVSPLKKTVENELPLQSPQEVREELDHPEEKSIQSPANEHRGNVKVNNSPQDDFVFPSADLLDYEKETYLSVPYSLTDELSRSDTGTDESHSFSEWLSVLREGGGRRDHATSIPLGATGRPSRKMDLIDNFLNNGAPRERIVPNEEKKVSECDVVGKSVQENEDLMTETLANIFIRQKHYRKAANIFERLRLKYPEKSVYFVRRIKELEELINNQ